MSVTFSKVLMTRCWGARSRSVRISPGSLVLGVAAGDLGFDVVDERVLVGGEARPYALVAGLGSLRTVGRVSV